ncbi:MAG: hypothetical protein GC179_23700 [Anaerolineaceae bacterium]|nr:hypothetical protein [Anaerolineaceae bacterium]
MIRYIFRLILFSGIVLSSISLAAKIVGKSRVLHPVITGLDTDCEGKPQPCWYGVVLGETTAKDVMAIFSPLGDRFFDNTTKGQLEIFKTTLGGCFAQFVCGRGGSTVINEIILTNCARVRLGDLLARYGEPETLGTTINCDPKHPIIQLDNYFIEYPADGIIAAINRPARLGSWLSLQGNVRQLYLVKPRESDGRKTWEGIISFRRFVRLHPEQIRSSGCGP